MILYEISHNPKLINNKDDFKMAITYDIKKKLNTYEISHDPKLINNKDDFKMAVHMTIKSKLSTSQ